MEVDYHFIRDEYLIDNITPTYVSTYAQLADILSSHLCCASCGYVILGVLFKESIRIVQSYEILL